MSEKKRTEVADLIEWERQDGCANLIDAAARAVMKSQWGVSDAISDLVSTARGADSVEKFEETLAYQIALLRDRAALYVAAVRGVRDDHAEAAACVEMDKAAG